MVRHLALLLVLVLMAPYAAADQDIEEGPLHVKTQNNESGEGCSGENGSQQRHARAGVALTEWDELVVEARQTCWAYSEEWDYGEGTEWHEGRSDSLYVMAGKRTHDSHGPYALVYYDDQEHASSWEPMGYRFCSSTVYVAGPAVHPGCLPANQRPPMLPALP